MPCEHRLELLWIAPSASMTSRKTVVSKCVLPTFLQWRESITRASPQSSSRPFGRLAAKPLRARMSSAITSTDTASNSTSSCAHELGHHIYGHGEQFDELVEDRGTRKY